MIDHPARYLVCALYKFVPLDHFVSFQTPVKQQLKQSNIVGTLLLAPEGINGTIAGNPEKMRQFLCWLQTQPGLGKIEVKESWTHELPFKRSKVKLKKEIVTMGVAGIDPEGSAGTYVEPEDWNGLISDPEVVLIDTRNEYEIEVGQFEGAVNPHTNNFREFPNYAKQNLNPEKHKKVAMYCTGGIRCEKSTAFLKQSGFENVYHLKGGILRYLEKIPKENSKWRGECFIFDDRVTVDHDLNKGRYDQCHGCRMPITEEDKVSPHYQPGVCCPRCHNQRSPEDKARSAEREKQIRLAKSRGEKHIGPKP